MSVPNLNVIQPQNIVINPVPLTHTIVTNTSNGIPIALAHTSSTPEQGTSTQSTGIVVDTTNNTVVAVQNVNKPATITSTVSPSTSTSTTSEQPIQVLTKQRLQDLVRDTDPTLTLEDEVEEIIMSYVDEFVDRCLNGAALIAKNRHINTIEVKDVQQFLQRNYNMWTPGFGTDELKPYKRSLMADAHKQRLALIRRTLKK